MQYMIVSMDAFRKGSVPPEVLQYAEGRDLHVILDESSKIKTTNPCKESKKSQRCQELKKFSHNFATDRAILTGTLMSKSPVNVFDQVDFMIPGYFKEGIFSFAERYTIRESLKTARGQRVLISIESWNKIHKYLSRARDAFELEARKTSVFRHYAVRPDFIDIIAKTPKYTPFVNLQELYQRLQPIMHRVLKSDCYDVPDTVYKTIPVSLTDKQKKLYQQMVDKWFTDDIVIKDSISLYYRLQDVCNAYEPVQESKEDDVELRKLDVDPKYECLLEQLEEIDPDMEQVVIFCSRKLYLKETYERISKLYPSVLYTGKDSEKEVFQSGEARIFFAPFDAAAYGLDCLGKANYAIYLSSNYKAEGRHQNEHRIMRGKYESIKVIIDIVGEGTNELRVLDSLKMGEELISFKGMTRDKFDLLES